MNANRMRKRDSDLLIEHSLVLRKASRSLIVDTHALLKKGRSLRARSRSLIKQFDSPTDPTLRLKRKRRPRR